MMLRNQDVPSGDSKGLFELAPDQTTVLLLDFKSDGHALLDQVQQAIEPLRRSDYLSFWDGNYFVTRPITVVLTGNAPLEQSIETATHRDIFFDAPLARIHEGAGRWNQSNSYYASASLKNAIGSLRTGRLSSHQLEVVRAQIKAAKSQGLKVRYWDTPSWPTSLRNHVWQLLLDEGSDVLNVDDLRAAAFLDWRQVKHNWFDS